MVDKYVIPHRALISVHDKTGLIDFARGLVACRIALVSTGGSAQTLRAAGLPVQEVAEVTGFPEILAGRVKTLHPLIHGGILARPDQVEDQETLSALGIFPFDLVVVNLYPFREAIAQTHDRTVDLDWALENIDIGGPALIRAAAKNHAYVVIVTDPLAYDRVLSELKPKAPPQQNGISATMRQKLAAQAFVHTSSYDCMIADWMTCLQTTKDPLEAHDALPDRITVIAYQEKKLRYGENPHQKAGFYRLEENTPHLSSNDPGPALAEQIQGKELSYNNLIDGDTGFELVSEITQPAIAIIKHANPCGVAIGQDLVTIWRKALACDPVSAFGGVVAVNRHLDASCAEEIIQLFIELVIAPSVSEQAREIFSTRPNIRLLVAGERPDSRIPGMMFRSISGGILVQNRDIMPILPVDLRCVTERHPSEQECADLRFAFTVAKYVKSNAIVYAKDGMSLGIGAGQMSRVDSARVAAQKALAVREGGVKDSVVASDAFFPFADGIQVAVESGATAIIQPGGSLRDQEVIAAANSHGLAMVFTGIRHFRH